eukprot:7385986-Prymnesium_polylepis.1
MRTAPAHPVAKPIPFMDGGSAEQSIGACGGGGELIVVKAVAPGLPLERCHRGERCGSRDSHEKRSAHRLAATPALGWDGPLRKSSQGTATLAGRSAKPPEHMETSEDDTEPETAT